MALNEGTAALTRRVRLAFLGCVLVGLLSACSVGNDEASSCAGSDFMVGSRVVPVGGELAITGKYYLDGCDDVVEEGRTSSRSKPLSGVLLTLTTADGVKQEIAKLDARGSQGKISYTMTVPQNVAPGNVDIRLGDGGPIQVTVQD